MPEECLCITKDHLQVVTYLFLVAAAVLGFCITDRLNELKRGVRRNKEDIKTLEKVR